MRLPQLLHLRPLVVLSVLAGLPLAACAAPSSEEAEPEEVLASEEELRALASSEIVGTLGFGESKEIQVAPRPLYRAFKLEVPAGERLDIAVRSERGDGDPQAWLLASDFRTLARSVDVSATDPSARLTRTITRAGTYYVAVRDESSREVSFRVSRGPTAAPGPACTTDLECGGGAAMCFLDRCVTVSDSGFRTSHRVGGVRAAYDAAGELRVAHQQWSPTQSSWDPSRFSVFLGAPGAAQSVASGRTEMPFGLSSLRPGEDAVLSLAPRTDFGTSVQVAGSFVGRLGARDDVASFAFGKNAAGTMFAAIAATTPYPASSGTWGAQSCALYFASRPAGATWGPLVRLDGCSTHGSNAVAVHVRKDGGTEVVAAHDGGILLYRRQNPIDPWAKSPLVPRASGDTRSAFVAVRGEDGATHIVAQPYDFRSDPSRGDFTATYIELGDAGVVRSIPLGVHTTQYQAPYRDVALDGDGNVWIQKRVAGSDVTSIVRIDRAGKVAERSLGPLSSATSPSALAVSPRGEIALVHAGNSSSVSIRRFTPFVR